MIGDKVAHRLRHLRDKPNPVVIRDRLDEQHMKMLLAFALNKDSNCVDVGANRGGVLSEIVRLAPNGQHVAYEPLPFLADKLRAEFPGVRVRQVAVSDTRGQSTFQQASLDAYSGLRQREYPPGTEATEINVDVVTLDEDLADLDVAMLKIDVEGGEMGVLNGARQTLERCRPLVVFEHGAGAREAYGTTAQGVWTFFDELDMRVFDMDGGGPLSLEEFARESRGNRWNWVAH